jgi:predicted O-methyltransferase YrrM
LRRLGDVLTRSDRANYPRRLAVRAPNEGTVEFIKTTQCRHIAEFGIYEGHTSLEFAKHLNHQGELHLFDFEDRVSLVAGKLAEAGYRNVRTFGSSYKLLDSYNWSLAKILETSTGPIYDYIFIDGAHTWAIDGLTTLLADRLLKVGGYIDFDDYQWSLQKSPRLNPRKFPLTAKLYTGEQIEAEQVRMIVDLLVRRDPRYREVVPNAIFQKIA